MGRHSAFDNLAHGFRRESPMAAGRQRQSVRVSVENILSLADTLCALLPIDLASSAQKHEDSFLAISGGYLFTPPVERQ